MNQSSSGQGADALPLPEPTPFAAGSILPPSLEPRGGEPLLLLVNVSDDPAWAADTAVAIASAWASAGRRIVLADLHLEEPVLHERLGESNLDGIVDIFLYGASVARSARPPGGHGFFLIPAGTYTAAPGDVFGHPRWSKLIAGFQEAGATLLVFVPGFQTGAEQLARWGGEAVVLGTGGAARLRDFALQEVRAVLVPPAAAAEEAADDRLEALPLAGGLGGAPEEGLPSDPHGTRAADPADGFDDAGVVEDALVETSDPEPSPDRAELGAAITYGEPDDEIRVPEERERREEEPFASDDDPYRDGGSFASHLAAASGAGVEAERDWGAGAHRAEAQRETEAFEEEAPDIRVTPLATREERTDGAAAPHTPVLGPARRRRQAGPGPMVWLLVGAALLVLAVVTAAILRPDLFGREPRPAAANEAAAASAGAVEEIPAPPPTPQLVADTLPFAVQVRAYISLDPARTQAERQARRVPDATFYVVPELTQDVLYYKVLAGLLPDTASATALRRRLVESGVVDAQDARDDAPGTWSLIQARPYAFDMGEFPTREEAAARADSLLARRIPSYLVAQPYTDGSERWRVFAGAYADTLQAGELRRMLADAELPTRFVLRLGQGSPAPQ